MILCYVVYDFSYIFPDAITERINTLPDIIQEQKSKRIAVWIQSFYLINDNLFFGVGLGNFEREVLNYLNYVGHSEILPHPHHLYIDILSTLGIIGFFIIFIYILILIVYYVNNTISSFLALYILFGPFTMSHSFTGLWFVLTYFIVIGIVIIKKKNSKVIL